MGAILPRDTHFYVEGSAKVRHSVRVSKETISNFEIPLPPKPLIDQYSNVVTNLFDQRETLDRKNHVLRTSRDLLLPKLISGQLDMENLDIDVGEAVTA